MTDFISILQNAAFQASEMEAQRPQCEGRKWKLNYKWLVNPKIKCPWCAEWIPTKRVWVVDEAETRVRRLWTLTGERLSVEVCHPHVGDAGKICMGSADTAVDALFASISNDAFAGAKPDEWFSRELGHECSTMGDPLDDEDSFQCYGCGRRYDNDESYYSRYTEENYCQDCYYEVHTSCEHCGSEYHTDEDEGTISTPYGEYCRSCFSSRFFECEACDEINRLDWCYGDSENLCHDCWSDKYEICTSCGDEFERELGALDGEGLCEDCRPEPEIDLEEDLVAEPEEETND